jgi:hypothetical protein
MYIYVYVNVYIYGGFIDDVKDKLAGIENELKVFIYVISYWLCICIYIYEYMSVYVCIYLYIYIHTCICIYIYIYTYTYICIYTNIYIYICIYSFINIYKFQAKFNNEKIKRQNSFVGCFKSLPRFKSSK